MLDGDDYICMVEDHIACGPSSSSVLRATGTLNVVSTVTLDRNLLVRLCGWEPDTNEFPSYLSLVLLADESVSLASPRQV